MQEFLNRRKYEVLLFALFSHLYNVMFFDDLVLYMRVIWPINMLLLGLASISVFAEKSKVVQLTRTLLFGLALFFPFVAPFVGDNLTFWNFATICYAGFFTFIFVEVLRFLIKPSYINSDIISAAICGFFLLIEIGIFLSLFVHNNVSDPFNNIATQPQAETYLDLVYFNTITITSIGYGDITPNGHVSKLLTSLIGVLGQFYTVVLVGIIISKYVSHSEKE